ncbi:IscS subfamily cysteine desulfurase [Arcticibacter sp. MXS-1]|uniref:IscS subfamily cysteine desulfurase n=1 Tax=Arcticibacter sp. MXS-1 TaxID=3341726 RepID=UPI0035A97834
MKNLPVYLDYNATTPVDPRVLEAMLPYFTVKFGNAASKNHVFGWVAEEAVDLSREKVAGLIGASEKEIVFTSGATEANNLAIKGVFEAYRSKGNHIITCQTEHKAVLDVCKHLEQQGARITYLPVKNDGLVDLQKLRGAITDDTILVAVMYANNETGVIQPVKDIAAIAHEQGALFFTDATQAVGKIQVDVQAEGIDLLSFSGHKLYAPKGIGALYVRRRNPRVRLVAQIDGGGHERGMRSGTLNVPAIVGLGKACELAGSEMKNEAARLSQLRDRLENAMISSLQCTVNGNIDSRMPHVTNLAFNRVNGQHLMMELKNVALSSGSACTSATLEPSYVLKAMGISDDLAHSSIRFSLGRFTTEEEIKAVSDQTIDAVKRLYSLALIES